MAVLDDTLFLSGRFGYVGPPTGRLAVLNKQTGEPDISLPRFDGEIRAVLPDGTGGYYVGGDFFAVAGERRRNLAHVRVDGTLDPSFRPDPELLVGNGSVGSVWVLALDGGTLYVGGQFSSVAGEARRDLVALDAHTGALRPFDAALSGGPEYPQSIYGVTSVVARDGVVYVGGEFTHVGGQARPTAVALDGQTGARLPWAVQPNSRAFPVAAGDSTLYLYGGFSAVNGQPRSWLAEVSYYGSGAGLTPWTPAQTVYGDDFDVSSDYLWVVQWSAPVLTRIHRQTGAVQRFSVGGGVRSGRALAVDAAAGVVYVACSRTLPSGSVVPAIVAVSAATGQATGYEVTGGGGPDGVRDVRTVAVEPGPDGRVLAGGAFYSMGGVRRPGLAALSLTSGRALDFGAPNGAPFEDLALSPDGRFLYGYYSVLGGLALRLAEYDLVTGAVREFFPQGAALQAGALPAPGTSPPEGGEAARVLERLSAPETPRAAGRPAPPPARASGTPAVENSTSAVVVTDDRVCVVLNGVACLDRATTDAVFYEPMGFFSSDSEDNGDLLLVPEGGPGGRAGTLFLAAPLVEAPVGRVRAAFAALDYATGAVIEPWDPLQEPIGGPEGYALAHFDPDGSGPLAPWLYLGASRIMGAQGQEREGLLAVEPATAALLPWAPQVTGGVTDFFSETVHAIAAQPAVSGSAVVYVGGAFTFLNGVRTATALSAFDAETGEHLSAWDPALRLARVLLVSGRHEAVFAGGIFETSLRGSGHSFLVAVTPAAAFPVGTEPVGSDVPAGPVLALAGPNPFRVRTALSLTLPISQQVEAALFDVLGRRVAVLYEGPLAAGTHRLDVDGTAFPAGVYVVRVSGVSFAASHALTLVR